VSRPRGQRDYPIARGFAPPPSHRRPRLFFIGVLTATFSVFVFVGWFVFQGPGRWWLDQFNHQIPDRGGLAVGEVKSATPSGDAVHPPPAPSVSFAEVEPIFQQHCVSCHSTTKLKGGLDLSDLDAIRRGGDSGPAMLPGRPDQSPLWDSIATGRMPPNKAKRLSDSDAQRIRRWIESAGR
jgi:mono/diheme cytochrome c family protein